MTLLTPIAFQVDVPPSSPKRAKKTRRCIKKCSTMRSGGCREDRLERKLRKAEKVIKAQRDAMEELARVNRQLLKQLTEKEDEPVQDEEELQQEIQLEEVLQEVDVDEPLQEVVVDEPLQEVVADDAEVMEVVVQAVQKRFKGCLKVDVTDDGLERPVVPRVTPARALSSYRAQHGLHFRTPQEELYATWFEAERHRRHVARHPRSAAAQAANNASFNSRTLEEATNEFEATTVPFEYTSEDEAMFGWC